MKTAIAEIVLAVLLAGFGAAVIAAEPESSDPKTDQAAVAEFSSIAVGPIDEAEDFARTEDRNAWPINDPKATKERLRTKVRHFGH